MDKENLVIEPIVVKEEWVPRTRPVIDEKCQECGQPVGTRMHVVKVETYFLTTTVMGNHASTSNAITKEASLKRYYLCDPCWLGHSNKIRNI